MKYRITTQKALRAEFWEMFPDLDRKKITNYSGNGKMFRTDTRVAFVNFVDMLNKDGDISEALAFRATLE